MGLVHERVRARVLELSAASQLDAPPEADALTALRAEAESAGVGLIPQIEMLRGVALLREGRDREALDAAGRLDLERLPFNAWTGRGALELAEALAETGGLEGPRREAARRLARWVSAGAARLGLADLAARAEAV